MKKKKRGITIQINLSNKVLYTLIIIGILAIVGVGVWAYGTAVPSDFGHSLGELETCNEGETLVVMNGEWDCVDEVYFKDRIIMWGTAQHPFLKKSCQDTCELFADSKGASPVSVKCIAAWDSSENPADCSTSMAGGICLCRGLVE